jgi:hypothetical protein
VWVLARSRLLTPNRIQWHAPAKPTHDAPVCHALSSVVHPHLAFRIRPDGVRRADAFVKKSGFRKVFPPKTAGRSAPSYPWPAITGLPVRAA